jgi:hypothetical protein
MEDHGRLSQTMRIAVAEGHVDIFEKDLCGNAANAVGKFDQIVADLAGMFAAERVAEAERFGELTGADEKTSAVNIPGTFCIHHLFYPKTAFAVCCSRFGLRVFR